MSSSAFRLKTNQVNPPAINPTMRAKSQILESKCSITPFNPMASKVPKPTIKADCRDLSEVVEVLICLYSSFLRCSSSFLSKINIVLENILSKTSGCPA